MTLTVVVLAIAAWFVISVLTALFLGRLFSIRSRSTARSTTETDDAQRLRRAS
jgi:hypothetical protein